MPNPDTLRARAMGIEFTEADVAEIAAVRCNPSQTEIERKLAEAVKASWDDMDKEIAARWINKRPEWAESAQTMQDITADAVSQMYRKLAQQVREESNERTSASPRRTPLRDRLHESVLVSRKHYESLVNTAGLVDDLKLRTTKAINDANAAEDRAEDYRKHARFWKWLGLAAAVVSGAIVVGVVVGLARGM